MRSSFNHWVSGLLQVLRWPLALLAVTFTPALLLSFLQGANHIFARAEFHLAFLSGFLLYLVLWFFLIRHWKVSWLSTLEHELTHAITAWCCGCKVTGLKTTWSQGGSCTYVGRSNWLIQLSPYFLPTFALSISLIHRLAPMNPNLFEGLLGLFMVYHLSSTLRETHRQQSDLIKAGRVISLCTLPSLNLFFTTWILEQVHQTPDGWEPLLSHSRSLWQLFLGLMSTG